jgi:hypothetical protein
MTQPHFEPPARKTVPPLTARERRMSLTGRASRPLLDWVRERQREGRPRGDYERERIVAMRTLIAEADANLAKLLEE